MRSFMLESGRAARNSQYVAIGYNVLLAAEMELSDFPEMLEVAQQTERCRWTLLSEYLDGTSDMCDD